MTTLEDSELIRRYAADRSEAAFAELVRRHLPHVYAFAVRQVGGDAHLAEDVAQMVFTALAGKAASLTDRQALGGWLYRTTHFAARDVVRAERRRRNREQEAQTMHESTMSPEVNVDWEKLHPVIDETLNELSEDDRDAVWLRFFEGRSFADVGAKLRLTENAARMRVERALDKLHGLLARRGVTSTTAALGLALANQATTAAPAAGLAASITGAALSGAATAGALGGAAIFMGMTKLQIGIAGALALAGGVGYFAQAKTNAALQREIAALREQQPLVAALRTENKVLANTAVEIETLRRDDAEFRRLAQRGEEEKKALEEKARVAAEAAAKSEQARMDQQKVRAEIERMNREGNALVNEYKVLLVRIAEHPESAEELKAAAEQKMGEIRAKQDEVTAFKERYRDLLPLVERPPLRAVAPTTPEIDEINRVGKGLVAEYQALVEKAKDPTLTEEAKAVVATSTQSKLEEIKAKQREVNILMGRSEAVAPVSSPSVSAAAPGWSYGGGGAGGGVLFSAKDSNQADPAHVPPTGTGEGGAK